MDWFLQNYDNYGINLIDGGNIKKGGMRMQIDQIILLILATSLLSKKSIIIEGQSVEGFFTRVGQISCQIGINFWGVLSLIPYF